MRAILLLSLTLSGCSCGEDPSGDGGGKDTGTDTDGSIGSNDGAPNLVCISELRSIALSPASSSVMLTGCVAAPITFEAIGRFEDGHTETLDATKLGWSAARDDDTE